MGKWCLHASSFIFVRIIIKVAGNQDRHKSMVEFDFGPNQTTHFGVTPQPLYNTIVGVQANFRISYPNRVVTRVKCIDYRKRNLEQPFGIQL